MVKRIRFSSVSTGNWDTDWFKYCLDDTIGSLITSAEGYQMLAKDIPLFNEVNALPIPMDIRRLDGKYHNSCRLKYNNTKLLQVPSTSIEESTKFFRRSIDRPDSSTSTHFDMF
jgi:hypothetical protein